MEKLLLPAIHLFALIAFIIYKTKDSFISFMKNRHHEVSDGLNRAKNQAIEVSKKKSEVEAKFESLQKEKDFIFSEWKEKEASHLNSIKETSPKMIAKMDADAEISKKSLEDQIRSQLMKKIADEIIVRVEEKVKAGLNDQTHKGMSDRFVKEVSA